MVLWYGSGCGWCLGSEREESVREGEFLKGAVVWFGLRLVPGERERGAGGEQGSPYPQHLNVAPIGRFYASEWFPVTWIVCLICALRG